MDAGLSCRETEKRMNRLSLDLKMVKAVFISHEHTDHVFGLRVLSKKYRIPVYITRQTEELSGLKLEKELVNRFEEARSVRIGDLSVLPFRKRHDAADPHSFMISSSSVHVGVFTDIGLACKEVIHYFKQCHAAFLEANYDTDMLMNGSYAASLKKRISHGEGHLSNKQALELFLHHRPAHMSHLILSHLSANNNKPELVMDLFQHHAGKTKIILASRYGETEVYRVQGEKTGPLQVKPKAIKSEQLKLFE